MMWALSISVLSLLALGTAGVFLRQRQQRAGLLEVDGGEVPEIEGARDLVAAIKERRVHEALWRPVARRILPGEPHALAPGEVAQLGIVDPRHAVLTREDERYWFIIPMSRRPGVWLGAFLPLTHLPEGVRFDSQRDRNHIALGGLSCELPCPEILFSALTEALWAELDAELTPGLAKKTIVGFSHVGHLRVVRSLGVEVLHGASAWTVERFTAWLEREVDVLAAHAGELTRTSVDLAGQPDEGLARLLEAAARHTWPAALDEQDFRQRLGRQRQAICDALISYAPSPEQSPSAWQVLLSLAEGNLHEWARRVLVLADKELNLGASEADVALALAWLNEHQYADHPRVLELTSRMDEAQIDRFIAGVLGGTFAGESLVRRGVPAALARRTPTQQWELLRAWVAARPSRAWAETLEALPSETWDVIEREARRRDVAAAHAMAHSPRLATIVEEIYPGAPPALRATLLEMSGELPDAIVLALLTTDPPTLLAQERELADAWIDALYATPAPARAEHARALDPRLGAILLEERRTEQLLKLLELARELGYAHTLRALSTIDGAFSKRLNQKIQRCAAERLANIPERERGKLTLSDSGALRGAISPTHTQGALEIIEGDPNTPS